MIDGDRYDICVAGQRIAVIARFGRGPGGESAAVQRYQHGAHAAVRQSARPHIECQAILTHAPALLVPADHARVLDARVTEYLRADGPKVEGIADSAPRLGRMWRQEAVLTAGVGAIADALESLDVVEPHAADGAGGGFYDRIGLGH